MSSSAYNGKARRLASLFQSDPSTPLAHINRYSLDMAG